MKEGIDPRQATIIDRLMSRCIHFTGLGLTPGAKCAAGIEYPEPNGAIALPCVPTLAHGREMPQCESFRVMTQQEAEFEADRILVRQENALIVRAAAHDHAKERGFGCGHPGQGKLACPIEDCGGTVRYSVTASNGHIMAACSNPNCARWME